MALSVNDTASYNTLEEAMRAFESQEFVVGGGTDPTSTDSIAFGGAIWLRGRPRNNTGSGEAMKEITGQSGPFNPSTTINFDLPQDAQVFLVVYDVLGRKVAELANGNYAAGYHSATWDVPQGGTASGVYFARFTATDAQGKAKLSKVSKLLLAK
jgi:hypothetical protein